MGEWQDFSSKFFCLTVPKKLVGEPFCAVFQKISFSELVYGLEVGGFQDFLLETFCLTVKKNSVGGILQCFCNFGYRKIWIGGGRYQDFPSNFFVSQCPKIW